MISKNTLIIMIINTFYFNTGFILKNIIGNENIDNINTHNINI